MPTHKYQYELSDIIIGPSQVTIGTHPQSLKDISSLSFQEYKPKEKPPNYRRYIKDAILYLSLSVFGLGILSSSTPVDFSAPPFKELLPFLITGAILLIVWFIYDPHSPQSREATTIKTTYLLKIHLKPPSSFHLPKGRLVEEIKVFATKQEMETFVHKIQQATAQFKKERSGHHKHHRHHRKHSDD